VSNSLSINADPRWRSCVYDGGWSAAEGGELDVIEKAVGKPLAVVGLGGPRDLARASMMAASVQADWAKTAPEVRAKIMRNAANGLEARWDEIAIWIMRETGAIRPKADFEISTVVAFFNHAASMLSEHNGLHIPAAGAVISIARRVPLGTVGVIAPFNFPMILSMRAVAPALAVGNAVILKPDPQTPISGGLLLADILEKAGLPAGLFHVIPGAADVGEAMCLDPGIRMIAFTGSTTAGRRVGALASGSLKKVSLELGGKNALVVLDDADLELAVSAASYGAFLHQGQICMASGRILVQQTIADAFVAKLAEHARRLPFGDPMSNAVALGPLINERQCARVRQIVNESVERGATLVAGGHGEGLFFEATVLDRVGPGMPAFDAEVFGPVANVVRFGNDDEAVELANLGEYGLSAGVISRSIDRALALGERIRTGMLHINDQTVVHEANVPFGGMGASGNGGRIGGPANWDEFTQWQWVTVKTAPPAYPF